jgi:arsenite methyltransferase
MNRRMLTALCDPETGGALTLEAADGVGERVLRGTLVSTTGRRYPIEDGVPNLVGAEWLVEGQPDTVDSFSYKWSRASHYREATREHYHRWYLERYGFADDAELERWLNGHARILDAGTAHGRDAETYARACPQAEVFGIDISSGVALAERDLGHLPNVGFARADIMRLPFPPRFFDFIGCDQVIHHTPDTREALRRLLRHLAVGGHVSFYVYRQKAPIREWTDDFLRSHTVDMPPDECWRFSEAITKLGKALTDLHATVDVPEDIPLLGIRAGTHDVQRLLYWHVLKCYYNDTLDWDSNVATNFDWYHPRHAHRHTEDEVRAWCREERLEIEHLSVQESGISVRARLSA